MGDTRTDEGAGFQRQIQGNESKPVGQKCPARRRARRTIAKAQIDGHQVKVWLEGNLIRFRQKHRRKVTTLSLSDAYDFSRGQTQFYYAKGN
jgi:hypothetical protein